MTAKSMPRSTTPSGLLVEEDAPQLRVGLTEHQDRVRLDDARLLAGDSLTPIPHAVGVVAADVGDHCDFGIDHVGRVETPQHTDLDDGDIDDAVGEPLQRTRGDQLEIRRAAIAEQRLEGREVGDDVGKRLDRRWARGSSGCAR